ncbi:MAG TPA: hypothetical protein VHL58_13880 [Thermoanaerobaculia bacterium]|nr:hypothetical protein [Thermoanaerobaculia bacterium]
MRLATILILLIAADAAAIPIIVRAPVPMAAYKLQIESIDQASYAPLLELTGTKEPQQPIEVQLEPERSPAAASAPPWISGWAFGDAGLIVMIPTRAERYPDNGVDELLRHEMAHVLESRAAGGREIPRWFNEGLAMFASRGWRLEDRSRLAFELMRGDQIPIAELDELFGADEGGVSRAYAISGAFVRDLILRHGRTVPGDILQRIAKGQSFADAFAAATGESFADAEAAFWRRQTLWNRWVPFLTSSVALWLFTTFLAIWAIRKRRVRDRLRAEEWDESAEGIEIGNESPDPEELVN